MKREADHLTVPRPERGISGATVAIAVETPLQDDVRALVSELNETLLALTPLGVLWAAVGAAAMWWFGLAATERAQFTREFVGRRAA